MSKQEHRPLVVSGPSGSGKSTLLNRLFAEYPDTFGFSVSHTTRAPRAGEENGKQYHFVSRTDFQKMIDDGSFIEHAEFSGNMYGTSVEAVKKVADEGKIAVLDVDMQGVKSVKKTDLNARSVFIRPPSLEVLEQRLRGRNTETEEAVTARLEIAKAELAFAEEPGSHDFIIVNDDLEEAYKKLKEYVVDNTGNNPSGANPMVNSETPDPAAKEAEVVVANATNLTMTPVEPIPGESKKSTEKLAEDKAPVSAPEAGASGAAIGVTDKADTAAIAGTSTEAAATNTSTNVAAATSSTSVPATSEVQGKKKKEKEKQKSKSCQIL